MSFATRERPASRPVVVAGAEALAAERDPGGAGEPGRTEPLERRRSGSPAELTAIVRRSRLSLMSTTRVWPSRPRVAQTVIPWAFVIVVATSRDPGGRGLGEHLEAVVLRGHERAPPAARWVNVNSW